MASLVYGIADFPSWMLRQVVLFSFFSLLMLSAFQLLSGFGKGGQRYRKNKVSYATREWKQRWTLTRS